MTGLADPEHVFHLVLQLVVKYPLLHSFQIPASE